MLLLCFKGLVGGALTNRREVGGKGKQAVKSLISSRAGRLFLEWSRQGGAGFGNFLEAFYADFLASNTF